MFLFVTFILTGIILTCVISKIAWMYIEKVEKKQSKQQSQENKTGERNYE